VCGCLSMSKRYGIPMPQVLALSIPLFFLLAVHLGCQQRTSCTPSEGHPCETLDRLQRLCPKRSTFFCSVDCVDNKYETRNRQKVSQGGGVECFTMCFGRNNCWIQHRWSRFVGSGTMLCLVIGIVWLLESRREQTKRQYCGCPFLRGRGEPS
jgi:hypothetical protein